MWEGRGGTVAAPRLPVVSLCRRDQRRQFADEAEQRFSEQSLLASVRVVGEGIYRRMDQQAVTLSFR